MGLIVSNANYNLGKKLDKLGNVELPNRAYNVWDCTIFLIRLEALIFKQFQTKNVSNRIISHSNIKYLYHFLLFEKILK